MVQLNLKAIAAGAVVMLVLSVLFSLVLFLVYASSHLPPNPSQAALTEAKIAISQDSAYLVFDLVLGALASAFGGFLAARISKTLPLFNALAVGVIGLAAMAYVGDGGVESPWWYLAAGCVLCVISPIVGALWQRNISSV